MMPSRDINLSIVIAVYKVEPYLIQCIESVLNQDYPFFELILVDDGSPDRCPAICDEYAAKDNRIKVIHQANQGVVAARWNGILAASGEYISLIDGDDWVEPDMYRHMIDLAKGNMADLVIVGYQKEKVNETAQQRNALDSGLYKNQAMDIIYRKALYCGKYYEPGIIPALWNKIIKRDLFFSEFKPSENIIRLGEDASVTYPMIAKSESVVIDNAFHPYHYRVIDGSMSNSFDELFFDRAIALLKGLKTNLAINERMQSGLKYYGLFISQIGIMTLFSRNNTKRFNQRVNILKQYHAQYKAIGITEGIDWDGFDSKSKSILQPFVNNHLWLMILRLYYHKGLKRLFQIFG